MIGVQATGRIVFVNAQAEHLFGYERVDLLGRLVEELVPTHLRDVHPQHRERYFAAPKARPMGVDLSLFARRRDGTEFPCEISLNSLDTDDGMIVVAAIRDISDRVAAQQERVKLLEQLHETQRVAAARERMDLEQQLDHYQRLDSIGQLAGGVAHDFNNLLAVILKYTGFIADELPPDNHALIDDVEQVRLAAERAASLTKQLLIFARREVVSPRVLDLNAVILELEKLLRRALGEHIVLKMQTEPRLARIEADPGRIEQVIVNLAANARDAMPRGGELIIVTDNVELTDGDAEQFLEVPPGNYVRLTVTDTGHGMPPEVLERAFEPFFSTKRPGEGTGLGLATVYGIVRQAGGVIYLYSEVDQGTAVRVYLPATQAEPAAAIPSGARAPVAATGESVLVVEDEDAVREIARRILTKHGYVVLTAPDAERAIELASTSVELDLVLTDVVMPRMSGRDLAVQLRAARPGLKILYMSGYPQGVIADHGVLEEGVVLLEKPFTEADLLAKVRQTIDGGSGE